MTMHRTTARKLLAALDRVKMTRTQLAIFGAIASGRGNPVSRDAIVEAVWGHRADGGPLTAEWVISVHVCTLRKKGFDIRARYIWGYYLVPSAAKSMAWKAAA